MITNRIDNPYSAPCSYDFGGIQRLFVSNFGDSSTYAFSDIKTIDYWESSFMELKIDIEQTKIDIDYDVESRRFIYKLNIYLNNMSDGWQTARQLENGRFTIAWKDNLGDCWIAGLDTGFRIDPSNSSFNLLNTNRSWNLNMRESSRRPLYKIKNSLVEPPIEKSLTLDGFEEGFLMFEAALFD